jgi:class 3 adenylate cyclase
VSNLHEPQPTDHVKRIALFSQDAIEAANSTLVDEEDASLGHINLRVGFHSGPCVSNVVVWFACLLL